MRAWAIAAAAILAAAAADAATELAGNSGWLDGGLPDNQHESIVPALVIGTAAVLALLLSVFFARMAPEALARTIAMRTRLADIASAFCGSALCVVAMEGYETRFGGLSPFDPGSVVLSHTLALLVASLVMVTAIHCALRAAIRVTRRASIVVAGCVVEFLRRQRPAVVADRAAVLSAFDLLVTPVPLGIAHGARGLRAPPHSILLATL